MSTQFYYFKRDGRCKWAKEQIKQIPFLLLKMGLRSKIPYYIIANWNSVDAKGIQREYLKKKGIPYVDIIEDLPENSGVFVSAYDGDPVEIERLRERGIPIYEQVCPWIKKLRKIFMNPNENYQYVFMCEDDHMVAVNYRNIFPNGTILINRDNYTERMKKIDLSRPIHFVVYAAFRMKDAQRVIDYIKQNYNHYNNIYCTETICQWAEGKDTIFTEINEVKKNGKVNEVWLINSSEKNTSVQSIMRELDEVGLKYRLIKTIQDIKDISNEELKNTTIGILRAPNPYFREEEIINYVKKLEKKVKLKRFKLFKIFERLKNKQQS